MSSFSNLSFFLSSRVLNSVKPFNLWVKVHLSSASLNQSDNLIIVICELSRLHFSKILFLRGSIRAIKLTEGVFALNLSDLCLLSKAKGKAITLEVEKIKGVVPLLLSMDCRFEASFSITSSYVKFVVSASIFIIIKMLAPLILV